MMQWLEPVTLRGTHATLEPLRHDHHDDLVEAVKDGQPWALWYTTGAEPAKMRAEIDRRLGLAAKASMLPFAVIDRSCGKAAGMTTFMNADVANRRVEIGATWYRRSIQRTAINTECKLMM